MVDPNIWGKHGWKFLHYVAQGYPDNPTNEDKSNYKNFFLNIKNILPCFKCQNHYKGHLTNFPITDKVLNNKESLENWVINVHNQVNLMNGKNIIDRIPLDEGSGNLVYYSSDINLDNFFYPININKLTIQLYEEKSDTLYDCQNNDNSFEFELTILNKHI